MRFLRPTSASSLVSSIHRYRGASSSLTSASAAFVSPLWSRIDGQRCTSFSTAASWKKSAPVVDEGHEKRNSRGGGRTALRAYQGRGGGGGYQGRGRGGGGGRGRPQVDELEGFGGMYVCIHVDGWMESQAGRESSLIIIVAVGPLVVIIMHHHPISSSSSRWNDFSPICTYIHTYIHSHIHSYRANEF